MATLTLNIFKAKRKREKVVSAIYVPFIRNAKSSVRHSFISLSPKQGYVVMPKFPSKASWKNEAFVRLKYWIII